MRRGESFTWGKLLAFCALPLAMLPAGCTSSNAWRNRSGVPITTASGLSVERISQNELKAMGEMQDEQGVEKEIELSAGLKMRAVIEVTPKGNGHLHLGNLHLKVYDDHDDGSFYENRMLKIEFADLDGDGTRELVISGTVCFTDEKDDAVLRWEAVVFIYALQPDRNFRLVYRNTDLQLD